MRSNIKMKIKAKLYINILLAVVFCIFIGVGEFYRYKNVEGTLIDYENTMLIVREVYDLNFITYEFLENSSSAKREQWNIQHKILLNRFAYVTSSIEGAKELMPSVELNVNSLRLLFDKINELENTAHLTEKPKMKLKIKNQLSTQMLINSRALYAKAMVLVGNSHSQIRANQRTGSMLNAAILLLFAFILVFMTLAVSRAIYPKLARLKTVFQQVATGDLSVRSSIQVNDEIGEISKSFDTMLENLSAVTVSRDKLVREVEERKQIEEALRRAQKMEALGNLTGGIAHDFNNLLAIVQGNLEILERELEGKEKLQKRVNSALAGVHRGADITKKLLKFSRPKILSSTILSVNETIVDMEVLIAKSVMKKITIKLMLKDDLWLCEINEGDFQDALLNLVINARDAMPDGGKLTIRTANVSEEDSRALDHSMMPDAEYVLIEVSDTGVGIPQENMDKIFEPFFTTKDVNKGTGLGLSTVYGIVKQTGGFIFPFSTLNKGTSFRIYLPRHIMEAGAVIEGDLEAAIEVAESKKDLSGHGTILLVEDEDAVRTFAARALQSRGYDVLEAEAGDIALEVVDDFDGEIDLVVSDVVMPNMDGPTMIKHLRKIRPDIKVIFVSGYAEDAFEKSLDPDQEFRFLPKPFSLKQLAGAVKEAIEDD